MSVDMSIDFAGITCQNPVSTASGTYGFGTEYGAFLPVETLGSITSKGITLKPRRGNPGVRLAETPSGMLNSIGLENPGLEAFVNDILPEVKKRLGNAKLIVNIDGDVLEDYIAIAARLNDIPEVDFIEVNISCPNVACGGMAFGTDPKMAAEVCKEVVAVTDKKVIMKLSPNVTDIVAIATACENAGADALSLINTLLGMKINVYDKKPYLGNVTGGLSGPAIRPVGVRMTWQVSQAVSIPILGMGGIATAEDALEYILAGADMIAVGAANFANPQAPFEILQGLESYCENYGIKKISDLVGASWKRG